MQYYLIKSSHFSPRNIIPHNEDHSTLLKLTKKTHKIMVQNMGGNKNLSLTNLGHQSINESLRAVLTMSD